MHHARSVDTEQMSRADAGPPPRRTKRASVLLAEDQPAMRVLVASQLRAAGYHVTEVPDGRELLRELEARHEHDVIVSDVRMPACSGLQVLELVRRADWATPVILMTAFGDRETHEEAKRLGAARLFDKPFDVGELVQEVLRLADPDDGG